MASVNKVILVGNLGKDPVSRFLPSGVQVVSFSVATSDKWTDKAGEKQEHTEWSRCSTFGKLAEVCEKYLKKGSQVFLEGKLHTTKYQKDGQDRYSTEIRVERVQFLGGAQPKDHAEPAARPAASKTGGADQMDDSIPF